MTARLVVALAALALLTSACGSDDASSGDPGTTGASSDGTRTPGDVETSWSPAPPDQPADEADVRATYDPVLDAATDEVDDKVAGLSWSASELRTEVFEGACAVTLERTADGPVPPPGDDTLELGALSAAVGAHGFGDLAPADDPGGAIRYLAQDDADALFELRSKDVTTAAVRVPTTTDSCSG